MKPETVIRPVAVKAITLTKTNMYGSNQTD